jgi:hypothetical protein
MRPSCNAPSAMPFAGPASPSTRPATPSAIRLQPICWRMGMTSARPGAAWAPGCEHDHDLHARAEPRPRGGPQPGRPVDRTVARLCKPPRRDGCGGLRASARLRRHLGRPTMGAKSSGVPDRPLADRSIVEFGRSVYHDGQRFARARA